MLKSKEVKKLLRTRIGYNCINQSIGRTYSSYRLQTVMNKDLDKIKYTVDYNLITLGETIYWNTQHNYRLFRLSSNLIPFLSHEKMLPLLSEVLNRDCVINEFDRIYSQVKSTGTRITIHPSQMNVLSTTNKDIIKRTIKEIELQTSILKLCGGDTLLLHLGGAYGDKKKAKRTLINNIKNYLSDDVKSVLAFENDDKTFNSLDVAEVCTELNLPWVYDFHHENLNKSRGIEITELLKIFPPTKYHICSGRGFRPVIPHDDYVEKEYVEEFFSQLETAGIQEADIMFEAKQKNLAVEKIMSPIEDGYWVLK